MSNHNLAQRILLIATIVLAAAAFGANSASAVAIAVVHDQVCGVTEPVCILVVPDGSGMRFEEARDFEGGVVDATIWVQLMGYDEYGPLGLIYLYPAEDIWLEASEDHSRGCESPYVATADGPTDEEGWTTFSEAPRAGGWTQGDIQVWVGGAPSSSSPYDIPSLPISFNSPDINADGLVNLTDIVFFSGDLGSIDAPFRSDLAWDGVINLSDIAVFASHIGAACP